MNELEFLDTVCRESLYAYIFKAFEVIEPATPLEDNWHIGCMSEHLEAVSRGEIQDLIINISPRMLKSVHVGQIFPTWQMGRDPSHQFINASYAHTLAERNVMKARQIIQSEFYKRVFPDVVISKDNNQKDYFTTTENGQYKGTGIGGTITGFGCKTLIVDDPINPKEAVSDTIRVNAINEIRSTLFSRFNNYKERRFVMIMQRLHEADPTGDLLEDEGYYHLKLPSIAPKSYTIELNGKSWSQEEGEYLSPRLGKPELDRIRESLTEYHFSGQYLQEPVSLGGGEFKGGWINYYPQGSIKPRDMNVYILVDAAGGEETNKKKKKTSDWTAMMVVGLAPDNNYYLLDIVRDRLNPTERVDTLFTLHRKWNALCGRPPKVGYEKYGMMTDTHYIKEKMNLDAYHFTLVELGGRMQKEERIRRLIPDLQIGRWFFPSGIHYVDGEGRSFDLVKELVDSEMPNFPRARFDDMLDALSRIYEDDLLCVFPQLQPSEVQRAYDNVESNDSWEDW